MRIRMTLMITLTILLSLSLLPAESVSAAVEDVITEWADPVPITKGDLNDDGAYTFRDALRALQICTKVYDADEEMLENADVTQDGEVTEDDFILLYRAALGEYTSFGYEKPEDEHIIYVDCKTVSLGEYCFQTLGEALEYVNANPPSCEEERITILFAPGDYREYTVLTAPYVTYEAMYPEEEKPNLTFYYGCGLYYYSIDDGSSAADGNYASTVISSTAHDFIAVNMKFENSFNIYITDEERTDYYEKANTSLINAKWTLTNRESNITSSSVRTQALALRVDADRCQFYGCEIIGRQDTLLMHNSGNRVYFEDCFIEGTVDFIYGGGTAVFESCTINGPYGTGHVTAASTAEDQPYGFLFSNCKLTREATTENAAAADDSYSLGRPWNNPSMVVFYCCMMDEHISDKNSDDYKRFVQMGTDGFLPENCRYAEYGTMDINGNLLNLEEIVPDYETILTAEDFETDGFYAPYRWLCSRYNSSTGEMEYDGWNPGGYEVADEL